MLRSPFPPSLLLHRSELRRKYEEEYSDIKKKAEGMEEQGKPRRESDERIVFDRLTAPMKPGELPPVVVKKKPPKPKAKPSRYIKPKKNMAEVKRGPGPSLSAELNQPVWPATLVTPTSCTHRH